MAKKRILFVIMTVVVSLSFGHAQLYGIDWGTDLLNGEGSFETQGAGGAGNWTFWADGGQISEINSTNPFQGSYSWYAYCPTSDKQARAFFNNIVTVGNRRHLLSSYCSKITSTPSFVYWSLGSSGQKQFGSLFFSYTHYDNLYTTVAGEDLVDLAFYFRSNSTDNDAFVIDNVELYRERVLPMAGSDSAGRELAVGEPTNVVFETVLVPDPNTTIAFDPDIVITALNASVSNVVWQSDNTVSAELTAVSAGAVQVMFQNVYSQKSYMYQMVAGDPSQCGDLGTQYLGSDISGVAGQRDCHVDLNDFLLLANQWMQCTDMANVDCQPAP